MAPLTPSIIDSVKGNLPESSEIGPESGHHLRNLEVHGWIIGAESAHPEHVEQFVAVRDPCKRKIGISFIQSSVRWRAGPRILNHLKRIDRPWFKWGFTPLIYIWMPPGTRHHNGKPPEEMFHEAFPSLIVICSRRGNWNWSARSRPLRIDGRPQRHLLPDRDRGLCVVAQSSPVESLLESTNLTVHFDTILPELISGWWKPDRLSRSARADENDGVCCPL